MRLRKFGSVVYLGAVKQQYRREDSQSDQDFFALLVFR
jgi:hypothetical protein